MNISFNPNTANSASPKVRRQKFGIGSLLLVLLVGLIFTSAGLLSIEVSNINPNWTKVSGQVASVSTSIGKGSITYTPVVQYQVNGQTYKVTDNMGSSSYPQIGSSMQVAYDPSQPQDAKVVISNSSKTFLYIFPLIGIICLIAAPIAFVRSLRRSGDIQSLMRNGQKLPGVITDIKTYANNNNNTYKIVVTATNSTGIVQGYISDSLANIGGLAVADFRNNPIPVDVYVNPANPTDYYVDVSDTPNLTPERIADLIKSAGRQTDTFAQSEQPAQLPQSPVPNIVNPTITPTQPNIDPQPPQQPLT